MKKPKKLKLKDTESIAGLFTDDLVRYYRMSGDMKHLTAKKVYTKLRGSDEKVYDHGDLLTHIKQSKAEINELLKKYPDFNVDNYDDRPNRDVVDLLYEID